MDIRFLETFLAIVDCGSIAETARRTNKTPAALSQRIQVLEQELGHKLIIRSGRTVQPTAAGLAVLERARELVEKARDLSALAANGAPAGQLRIGATSTALIGLMPDIITMLSDRYPAIDYFVQPGSSSELYHRVIAGELDAALIVRPDFALPKAMGWSTIREEPLVFIAPHSLPELPPHALIASQRFILYDRNQWGGQIVARYLAENGLAVREWLELDALDAIAALVSRGLGVAIVPDWAPPWPEGLKLRKILLPSGGVRKTGVLWRRSGARAAAIEAFVSACRDASRRHSDGNDPTATENSAN